MLTSVRFWAVLVLVSVSLPGRPVSAQHMQTHTIEITGLKFVPEVARGRVGDTISFVNMDLVPHTATQASAGWDSGLLAKGKSWFLKLEAAGTLEYYCRFHPTMRAKIEIE